MKENRKFQNMIQPVPNQGMRKILNFLSHTKHFSLLTKEQAVFDSSPTDTPDTTQLIQG